MRNLNNRGQALVEYVLIIGVVTVLAVTLVKLLGGYLKDAITKSSCPMVGQTYVEGKKRGEGYCTDSVNSDTNYFSY